MAANHSGSADTDTTQTAGKMCEVCQKERRKYTCPRCSIHTCSLPCVQKHKSELGCDGKRDKTAFIAKDDYTESHFHGDYFFLEEMRNKVDVKRKELKKKNFDRDYCARVKYMVENAKTRGVFIDFMFKERPRHQLNKSFFNLTTRNIHWTVEWKFPKQNVCLTDESIPDTEIIQDIVDRHVKEYQEQAAHSDASKSLDEYSAEQGRHYKVLFKIHGKNQYCVLDKAKSLFENLSGKRVVEYPTLLVVEESEQKYPLVSEDAVREMTDIRRQQYTQTSRMWQEILQESSSGRGGFVRGGARRGSGAHRGSGGFRGGGGGKHSQSRVGRHCGKRSRSRE